MNITTIIIMENSAEANGLCISHGLRQRSDRQTATETETETETETDSETER
jgi:hypothetical protein